MKEKKFKLFDAVLMAVCVILVAESAAPAASVGPSQFFWWGAMLLLFFLPYGLISAELGTTYDDEGGLYDWIKRAYGGRWGGRVAWLYWINFPLWMGSLAVIFTPVIEQAFNLSLSTPVRLGIQLTFLWITVVAANLPIANSKWILNIAAIFKVAIMLGLGVLGIYFAITQGVANDFSGKNLLPDFSLDGLAFISVIIFNFLGFEVITTMAGEMPNPKQQIPKAIVIGGVLISAFYLLAAFGIGVAIPFEELSLDSGLLDSFAAFNVPGIIITIVGVMFLYTLVANLICWAIGVNYVANYAAKNNDLPAVFGVDGKKHGMPVGAGIINGVIASLLVIIAPIMEHFQFDGVFWTFFALNLVTLLASYIMMFPAFLKLRKMDPERERPYRVPGGKTTQLLLAFVPMILLIATLIFTAVPLNGSTLEMEKLPILYGTVVALIIGEVCIIWANKRKAFKKETNHNDENN